MYNGWQLTPEARDALLAVFPPKYPDVVAHHVTHRFGDGTLLAPGNVRVIGYVDDGVGLEALVVSVNGLIGRLDGGVYHITWSLNRAAGRKPVDSNEVIRKHGVWLVEPRYASTVPFVGGV